ncbi:MAG: hypothetical protein HKP00_03985 [Flavobacteriaceae bacterium]|nr:hypothetical protein [Flavobacteriaceae bacterium]
MRVKSSNKFPFLFLFILVILAGMLWLLQTTSKKKASKYPITPLTEQTTTLDLVQISLNEKAYRKLKKKRNKAVSVGILEAEDSDFVPATITFNGNDYNAEVRLKGDWTIHLEEDKWSFRIKLKDDKTILGMRKFSLHHPSTRRYLNEWLYHRAMKKEGLMGLRYGFVEGKIHVKMDHKNYLNKDVGIYAIEETFDKRTIESNGRKESVIIKFSEDYWWAEVRKSKAIADDFGLNYNDFMNYDLISKVKYPIIPFSESKVLADTTMTNYFKIAKNLLEDLRSNNINISDAFDVEKLAMDTALMNLFGAIHGTYLINVRYYYNPITSKLEPISFDGNSGVKLTEFRHFVYPGKERDTSYFKALAHALNKVASPDYLDQLLKTNQSEIEEITTELKREFRGSFLDMENLRFNQNIMRSELEILKHEFNLNNLKTLEVALDSTQAANASNKTKIDLTNRTNWNPNGVEFVGNNSNENKATVVTIKRTTTTNSGFVRIGNIDVNFNSTNTVSIKVKKGKQGGLMGMRLQGIYPNRADAIFDLSSGKLKETFNQGQFSNVKASIKKADGEWYLCTLQAKSNLNKVNFIFGPTDASKKALNWEGSTSQKVEINVDPRSLQIKEN